MLLATFNLLENSAPYREAITDPWVVPLLFVFSGLLLATLLTQALNRSLYLPSFDGPSKIFLAALVFLYLRTRAISFARVLEFSLAIGLLAVYLVILSHPDTSAQWDGKNEKQRPVVSGIYLVVIELPGDRRVLKLGVQR